jgi:archaellum component FlaF (FlaF/FlaG flagellin family)
MFPAAISFAALLGAAAITATDVSYVRLETSSATVEAGKTILVDVYAYAHVPVNAVDITLQFDSSSVEVTGVDTGQSVLTIWTQEPVIEDGRVLLQGGTFRKGFLTEHKIATVKLKAKSTGQSSFRATDVVLLAGDGSGTSVSVTDVVDSKINLYVYDENSSPGSIGIDVEINIISDIDGDGKVTLKDISIFMIAWKDNSNLYDFNGDGRMTFRDFSIILSNFFF